ncbi:DoxX family protein [Olivibacter sp. SDN3]|uniref:DoxX family protein n=1 Tax=Olivibacter sp. SDN3 TaxID=2764720 RepID=UPI0016518844|nr:DoxX family protein [Olivibacter sp. SDN3]QNL49361.1 DoxX family protein [Olivibacter sp. SDN3]
MDILNNQDKINWKPYERVLFRFFFIYFILQAVPLDWKYYVRLFQLNWFNLQFQDIFNISRYTPQLLETERSIDFWGIHTFGDWGILTAIALLGGLIWSLFKKKQDNYVGLYYVLRVILRYRLAIGVIAYGFIKLFPLQSPYPSLSDLNTNYGDLSAWRLFSLSLGVAPSFEYFLGAVEIFAGLLLFYRKTVFIGSFIILCFTGNVFLSNLAYEGGETVYSLYLIQFALFLLCYDAPRLFRLLSLERPTYPSIYRPVYPKVWQAKAQLILKSVFILFFVVLYGFKTYAAYQKGPYHYPEQQDADLAGFYDVSRFVFNGTSLPYNRTDSIRWENVVIERWPTLSIKTGKQAQPVISNVELIHPLSEARNFEYAGTVGRHYYRYQLDTMAKTFVMNSLGNNNEQESYKLTFDRHNDRTILLHGTTGKGDSLTITLNKIEKKYLLEEAGKVGRRSRLVL